MSLLTSTKRSTALLRCDPGLLYEILTDYDNYAEWLPRLSQSKSLATEGDLAIAEFHLSNPQKDRWVVECIHTRNRMVLWRTIEGKVPVTQVEWTIDSAADGQSRVNLAVERRFQWSNWFAGAGKFLNPPAALKSLLGQVSSYLPEIAIADAEGEKILELTETEQGVVCWIRGKKYILKEESPPSR
ncbi:MAG: SRPBCC family protein [Acidobacteria bacterium]|nr:SRPBCC family protein [Acidobacteriota bacterium]